MGCNFHWKSDVIWAYMDSRRVDVRSDDMTGWQAPLPLLSLTLLLLALPATSQSAYDM